MTWLKTDDRFPEHRKVRRLSDGAYRLHSTALCACSKDETDGLVTPDDVEDMQHGTRLRKYIPALVEAGLWEEIDGGWMIHDFLSFNPSHDQLEAKRHSDSERQKVFRMPELREAVRARDADRCRYCGRQVHWADRRGVLGGTYDHVDPAGGSTVENLVVCCRGCNASKGRRTPDQAGMHLLSVSRSDLGPEQVVHDDPSRPVPTRPDPFLVDGDQYQIDQDTTGEIADVLALDARRKENR